MTDTYPLDAQDQYVSETTLFELAKLRASAIEDLALFMAEPDTYASNHGGLRDLYRSRINYAMHKHAHIRYQSDLPYRWPSLQPFDGPAWAGKPGDDFTKFPVDHWPPA